MSVTITGGVVARRADGYVGGFGAGYLEGTAVDAGTPDTPVSRWVYCYVEHGALAGNLRECKRLGVAAVKSAADGTWRIDELDTALRYTVISYDDTGTYDPVIKAGLVPTPYTPGTEPWRN